MTKRLDVPNHVQCEVHTAPQYARATVAGNTTNMLMEIHVPMRVNLPVYHLKCAIKRRTGTWSFDKIPPGKYRCTDCGRVMTVKPQPKGGSK